MKIIILTILLFAAVGASAQQKAETFEIAAKNNLTVKALDKQYHNALDADSTKSVFKGVQQSSFYNAYVKMLNDMGAYLHQHNYTWGKPTRIIHRIYFEPDGTIDHYLLNLNGSGMDATKKAKFMVLLNQFVKNYKIKITANDRFAQCGPAIYQD